MPRFLHTALSFLVASAPASASIVYVSSSATGTNDGSSWSNAHTSLRVALDTAPSGSEIWVAAGTYVPGPTADASDTFQMRNGVQLYGGFTGVEITRDQRDWLAHETVLSGDVGHDDVYGPLVWWQGWSINTANSAQVVTGSGTDASALLDGFTITAGGTGPSGLSSSAPEMAGGGMVNVTGSPTVRNCKFFRNTAAFAPGGGMLNLDASPTILRCAFVQNRVHLGNGGAIYNGGASAPVIEECTFVENLVTGGTGGAQGEGGAIMNDDTPPITIRRCVFEFNVSAPFFSTTNYPTFGGAIESFGGGLRVEDCRFSANRSTTGGAISTWGSAEVVDCVFDGNQAFAVQSSTSSVSIGGFGSALSAQSYVANTTNVRNCTIVDNAGSESALEGLTSAVVAASNCVLWGNTSLAPGMSTRDAQFHSNTTVDHCCVQGLFQSVPGDETPTPAQVPGCIDADPLLANAGAADFRLLAASPCVDAGSNALIAADDTTDLDGNHRRWKPGVGVSGAIVDMGAYEYASQVPGPCPTVVQDPAPAWTLVGSPAAFEVLCTGDPTLAYQWRRNGVNVTNGGAVSGANTRRLTIAGVTAAHAGTYDVVVTNGCGTATSASALLTLIQPALVTRYCFGDGTATTCPCGNSSGDGDDAGCLNSLGGGGTLTTGGTASIANDTLKLETDLLPNGPSLFFQGTSRVAGGMGAVFGDGLRCAGGVVARLAIRTSTAGGAVFPDTGEAGLSQRVVLVPGDVRQYQVWYRDSAAYCTSATFNFTNGIEVRWGP